MISVDTAAPARVRPEGISSGVPAGPETAPGVEAEVPRGGGQTNGAASEPPLRLPTWATMVPLSASRRVLVDLPNDPEEGLNDPAQVVVNQKVLHGLGTSGSGRSSGGWGPARQSRRALAWTAPAVRGRAVTSR